MGEAVKSIEKGENVGAARDGIKQEECHKFHMSDSSLIKLVDSRLCTTLIAAV